MDPQSRIALMLAVTLIILAISFGAAAILSPEFRDSGATIAGVTGGLVGSPLAIYFGQMFTKAIRQNGNGGDTQ
jgi:hypothetical protein